MDGCPWCERVRAAIAHLDLQVEERDVRAVSAHDRALREARGRGTVPVLRIDSAQGSEWIGESADIVRRLYADYGAGRAPTFFASTLPQRLGWGIGASLALLGTLAAPPASQPWWWLGASLTWLLGTRAPLLHRLFARRR